MGTPEFAVASLRILVENDVNIVGVITAPDKPQGRGKEIGESAVKKYAVSVDLKVLQPINLKAPEFIEELRMLNANLQVVVAFRMLPEVVWGMPELGTFNLHASLLPQYRGAAPINWAIINGEEKTGVTTFFLKHEIDTGNIIYQEETDIGIEENVGSLYDRLMRMGSNLVLKTVRDIETGNIQAVSQKEIENLKHAPKIRKEDCEIDWKKSAADIFNFVRGLSPYPAAWTIMHGKSVKIFSAELSEGTKNDPGVFKLQDSKLLVGTGTTDVILTEIQVQGKKRMKTTDFLRGYRWPNE